MSKHYCRKCHRELLKIDFIFGICSMCGELIPYDEYYEGSIKDDEGSDEEWQRMKRLNT